MSRKLTEIMLPGAKPSVGLGEWDEQTAETMVAKLRAYAVHLRAQAEAVEAAADDDFKIHVISGSIARRHVRSIQPGRRGEQ